jgi:hypothetical protein
MDYVLSGNMQEREFGDTTRKNDSTFMLRQVLLEHVEDNAMDDIRKVEREMKTIFSAEQS